MTKSNTVALYNRYPDKTQSRLAEGGKRTKGITPVTSTRPLVTIITVCFNSVSTIKQTFASVHNQSYPHIEYVVIDGGSTDGTLDIIHQHSDLIAYYLSEPDKGIYHAMNKGLSLATGDFILMLNSDDWYEPETVEQLVRAHHVSGCDFVGALARYVSNDGRISLLPSMRYDHATMLRMPLRHPTMLIPARVYNDIGYYNTAYSIIADFHYTLQLYLHRKTFYEVPLPLLNFRTTGVSSTNLGLLNKEHKLLLQELFPFLSENQLHIVSDHSSLTPDALTAVALAHYDRPQFVLAARDMINDFGRVWGGIWSETRSAALDKLTRPPYPKITVIIPLYNAAHCIEATLRSILNQDFDALEVICVNDCSADDSAVRTQALAAQDSRIRLISLPVNRGPGAARNEGIHQARGEFVFFLDADDFVPSGALTRLYEAARDNNSDLVRGAMRIERMIHGRMVKSIKHPTATAATKGIPIKQTTLAETPALLQTTEGHVACLYARSFVETVLYPEALYMGEDSLFFIRALLHAKTITVISDIVYVYQDNAKSAMNTYTFEKYMDEIKWRRRAWALLKDAGLEALGSYYLFDYWDSSQFDKISQQMSATNARAFFVALSDAFTLAGSTGAQKCTNAQLRSIINRHFMRHRVTEPMKPSRPPLTIALLTSMDNGGAGIAAQRCQQALRDAGHHAFSSCIFKRLNDPNTFSTYLSTEATTIASTNGIEALWGFWHNKVALSENSTPKAISRELFSRIYSIVDTAKLGESLSSVALIHLHWVVGMIDYSKLVQLIGNKPVVWTLHDMNPFTGGCHYSEGCENYRHECSDCPLIESGTTLAHDAWQSKHRGLKSIRNLHIVCPSQWLADRAAKSSVLKDRPIHVIPNFAHTADFVPTNKIVARVKLGLPPEKTYILFGAENLTNKRKGGHLMAEIIGHLKSLQNSHSGGVEVLLFGHATLDVGLPSHTLGYTNSAKRLALIYAAADVFAFPSLEDNAPQTVIESMLSGTPVVAFPIGNVPNLVKHKKTGYIARYRDTSDFANGLAWAIQAPRSTAATRKGLHTHLGAYSYCEPSLVLEKHLELYYSLIESP
jgi:glycosyltransferase involved in cell wall biosynthesis